MRVKHFKCLPSGRKSGGTAELIQLRPFLGGSFFYVSGSCRKTPEK